MLLTALIIGLFGRTNSTPLLNLVTKDLDIPKHAYHTVDGSEIPNNHLGCIKPCKSSDKLPTSTGAGFLPSTELM